MRVNRGLERLRKFFTKRGITLSAAMIAGAVSTYSVQAAPTGLAKSVTALAIAKGASASGSVLALVRGALKIMAWTKARITLSAAAVIMLGGGGVTWILFHRSTGVIGDRAYEYELTGEARATDYFYGQGAQEPRLMDFKVYVHDSQWLIHAKDRRESDR
jgi:hypothetical protein